MNNILREMFGVFINISEGSHNNNELVLYRNTTLNKSLVSNNNLNENKDFIYNSDSITPFDEAFPNFMKEIKENKLLDELNIDQSEDLFKKYFGDIDLDKLAQTVRAGYTPENNSQYLKDIISEGKSVLNYIRNEEVIIKESPLLKKYLEIRDMKVGEILDQIYEMVNINDSINQLGEYSPFIIKLIGLGIFYRSIVKLFANTAFIELPKNDPINNTLYRAKLLKTFMIHGGIPISVALFIISQSYTNFYIQEKIKKLLVDNSILDMALIPFLTKKTPNWKFLIYLIIGLILIYKPDIIDLFLKTYASQFMLLFIVSQTFIIIYRFFTIFIVRLSLNNKIIINETFPKFIKNWLSYYIDIPEESKIYYLQLMKREIQIYIGTIIFELFSLYFFIIPFQLQN